MAAAIGAGIDISAPYGNMVLDIGGQLFQITYFQHVKPGKGGAFVRSKLKNVKTGAVIDKTWTAGERPWSHPCSTCPTTPIP